MSDEWVRPTDEEVAARLVAEMAALPSEWFDCDDDDDIDPDAELAVREALARTVAWSIGPLPPGVSDEDGMMMARLFLAGLPPEDGVAIFLRNSSSNPERSASTRAWMRKMYLARMKTMNKWAQNDE